MPRSAVRLPSSITAPFEVYVNGVPQREGEDYEVRGRVLLFHREMVQEGSLGVWRWFLGAWGIGTYRQHHSVDVRYTLPDGRATVAEGLTVEPRV
jgi:hypothetical protein